ncbi:MAG TPA: RNA methyltransferase [Fibrobacteraceae bacterium]|jgi:23S rRNA (guanosine2251-2'-O)-methyltransferase|nr:RNA methyltransferase [Fibrobacter sp.]HOG68081.1 RNA methyltransferase [Fibrobacteraceae bacterium]HQB65221.1 RNA methyltransferase [Fibrobacteraceae bacterium]
MNFKENPSSFGRSAHFRNTAPRDSIMRRPRAEDVSIAMSDAETAPQVAVGGMKEVEELITKEPYKVHRVLFLHQSKNPRLYTLQKMARKNHIHVQQVEARILDSYARPNQGIVALCNEKSLLAWEDIAEEFIQAKEKDVQKIIAVGTNIEDPRNLGACIRSSLALGVDLLLIPAKGMCGITPTVARTSAGALEKLRICRPNNLEGVIAQLKEAGYQIVGLDAATDINLAGFDFEKQIVIAVGGEDQGLPPFIRKQCDAIVRIPMMPDAHSYNASVALSLGLYEISRTRIK